MLLSESFKPKRKLIIKKVSSNNSGSNADPGVNSIKWKPKPSTKKEIPNQGKLNLDASITDQNIALHKDLKQLNNTRVETERLVDVLYKQGSFYNKPHTYWCNARKEYLVVSKKWHNSTKELRAIIGKQLWYVRRTISTIEKMLNELVRRKDMFPLNHRDQRIYWVIQHLFDHQMYLYKNKVHKCNDRIVKIYQLRVRPIVRDKDKAYVELRAKINISEVKDFVRCIHIGWDNYDEDGNLKLQVEEFRRMYSFYSELLLGDKIPNP